MGNSLAYNSPLSDINWRFESYLNKKKAEHMKHMLGNGIPDYAYKSDLEYRKKLDSIPGLYSIAQKVGMMMVTREKQLMNMNSLAVGPNQFPEVYGIGCECAQRLGIGVPSIFITNTEELNAGAYASDDVEPFITVTNLMLKRMTLGELKAVIGHECGHIHNQHITYSLLIRTILGGATGVAGSLLRQFQGILTAGVQLTLNMWSRAAEVTADRAALLCCDDPEDAYSVNKKLLYGAVDVSDKIDTNLELDSLREQMERSLNNPVGIAELMSTHPLSIKRIFAELEFTECETFYSWRPDLKQPGQTMRSKAVTDERCKKYIDVVRGDRK